MPQAHNSHKVTTHEAALDTSPTSQSFPHLHNSIPFTASLLNFDSAPEKQAHIHGLSSLEMMSSQSLAIAATAMAVSGTVVLLTLCRQKPLLVSMSPLSLDPSSQPRSLSLRPCIKNSFGGERRRERRRKKKSGKKVQFSDRVEEIYFQAEAPKRRSVDESCRVRAQMPANQMALYRGILRDRVPAYTY